MVVTVVNQVARQDLVAGTATWVPAAMEWAHPSLPDSPPPVGGPPRGLSLSRLGECPAGGSGMVGVDSVPAFLLFQGRLPLVGTPTVRDVAGPPGLVESAGLVLAAVSSSCAIRPEMRVLGTCAAARLPGGGARKLGAARAGDYGLDVCRSGDRGSPSLLGAGACGGGGCG